MHDFIMEMECYVFYHKLIWNYCQEILVFLEYVDRRIIIQQFEAFGDEAKWMFFAFVI